MCCKVIGIENPTKQNKSINKKIKLLIDFCNTLIEWYSTREMNYPPTINPWAAV